MSVRSITNPVINKISKAEYDAKVAAGVINETMIADEVWINANVTIADQENLKNIKPVALSGSYNDLADKPTIPAVPTKTSELTNDSGFITADDIPAAQEVPTKTSDLTNDSGFITSASLPTKTSQLTNDSGFITGYTESDPTVPAWAKAAAKPSYSYNEITGKPTLSTVATSGSYNDLSNKPTLFSGSYNDLTDKPTIPSVTGLASETYVNTKINDLINSAPTTLDTLGEVATAIQNNSTVVDALNSAIGNKANSTDVTALSSRVTTAEGNINAIQTGKANKSDLSAVATSGSYNDLTNKPTLSTCTLKIWG